MPSRKVLPIPNLYSTTKQPIGFMRMSSSQLKYVVFVLIMLFGVGGALSQRKPVDPSASSPPPLTPPDLGLALRTPAIEPGPSADPFARIQSLETNPYSTGSGKEGSSPNSGANSVATGELREPKPIQVANRRGPNDAPRFHRVADGDTLESLAARYLGNSDYANAIRAMNPNVFQSSDLLPIGAVLRIPEPGALEESSGEPIQSESLAPLVRGDANAPTIAATNEMVHTETVTSTADDYHLLEGEADGDDNTKLLQGQTMSGKANEPSDLATSTNATPDEVSPFSRETLSQLAPIERNNPKPVPSAPVKSASMLFNKKETWQAASGP